MQFVYLDQKPAYGDVTVAPGPPEPPSSGFSPSRFNIAGGDIGHGGAGGAGGRLRGAHGQVHGHQRVRLRLRQERPLVPAGAATGGPRVCRRPGQAPAPELEEEDVLLLVTFNVGVLGKCRLMDSSAV